MPVHVTRLHLRDHPHSAPPPPDPLAGTITYLTLPLRAPPSPFFMPDESVISFLVYIRAR